MANLRVVSIDPKAPAEIIPVTFDFAKVSSDIATAVMAISVVSGTDAAVGSMLFGSSQISGAEVKRLIQAGVDGVLYLIRCDITNAAGEKYALATYLQVKEIG